MSFERRVWCGVLLMASMIAMTACQAPEAPLPESSATNTNLVCDEETGLDLFQKQIKPLLTTDRKASCQRCHLPGTDIAKFIRGETACQMMSCLIDQKLVDLDAPEQSKMLGWIKRGHQGAAHEAPDRLIQLEHEAFAQWIQYSASCHELSCPPTDDPCNLRPDPVGDMSKDMPDLQDMGDDCGLAGCQAPELTPENYGCDDASIVRAFYDHPNEWKGRCDHCHAPKAGLAKVGRPPMFLSVLNDYQGAEESVGLILEKKDVYLNLEAPDQSVLLLKPLRPFLGGIEHGGGVKIRFTTDELYLDLLAWIEHVAYCDAQDSD